MLEDKAGFTLAEILITLAIIGVVAALTIPSVVANYQKTQTVTQLKKTYSALSNTTNLAIAEHGPLTSWEVINNQSVEFTNKYLIPYLKVSKNCENRTDAPCAFKFNHLNKGCPNCSLDSSVSRFFLNDGTLIGVAAQNYINSTNGLPYRQAVIYIDVNGQKPPDLYGRDIFLYYYHILSATSDNFYTGKFMPFVYNWSRENLMGTDAGACNKAKTGVFCSGLIMKDGWQIKDDYPW